MVGEIDFRHYRYTLQRIIKIFSQDVIVDAPTFIILFCVSAIAPPAVVVRFFIQESEAIGISVV